MMIIAAEKLKFPFGQKDLCLVYPRISHKQPYHLAEVNKLQALNKKVKLYLQS